MKVYITKYALTEGILEITGQLGSHKTLLMTKIGYFYGKDWHVSKGAAIKHAEEMWVKKIANLKKQIEKLEAMKFN